MINLSLSNTRQQLRSGGAQRPVENTQVLFSEFNCTRRLVLMVCACTLLSGASWCLLVSFFDKYLQTELNTEQLYHV